jgi:hypothetical protein
MFRCTLRRIAILLFILLNATVRLNAQGELHFNPVKDKPFVFAIGAGYGISNNPCREVKSNENILNGITLSASLGYHVTKKIKLDFGPVIWIKSADLFSNNLPAEETTSNKRMLVSFNAYYLLSNKIPFSVKIGAGVGSMVYSPERTTVSTDGKQNNPTEFYSGFAATASLIYDLKLSEKIILHPTLNLWYTDLQKQKIDYVSAIDTEKHSMSGDLRVQMFFKF